MEQRKSLPVRYRRPSSAGHQHRPVDGISDRSWPGTFMAIGIFLFLFSFWFLGSRTLITYTDLFRWFALFAFTGNLVPYSRSGLKFGMERLEWFLFNLLAIGPFFFSIGLALNFFIHSTPEYFAVPRQQKLDVHRYWIENERLPEMRPIDAESRSRHIGWIEIGIANGLFGYPVITTNAPIAPG